MHSFTFKTKQNKTGMMKKYNKTGITVKIQQIMMVLEGLQLC